MMKILKAFFVLLISVSGSGLCAEPLSVLVSERIEQDYSHHMPNNVFLEISFFGSDDLDIKVIHNFQFNEMTGQFALAAVDVNGNNVTVNGISISMINLPVPNRKILPDEIILDSDISLIEYQYVRSGAFTVLEEENIIGMQARRMLAKGRPIAQQSLTPPIVVNKGDRVNIVFNHNSMSLSAKGKALNEGYVGKEIKIVNLISHKTVVGIVKQKGIVEVVQ